MSENLVLGLACGMKYSERATIPFVDYTAAQTPGVNSRSLNHALDYVSGAALANAGTIFMEFNAAPKVLVY
jgi:hypothetical protein